MMLLIMKFIKNTIVLWLLTFSINVLAFNIGFNQAWFKSHYSTQYLNGRFDSVEVDRIMRLSHEAGAQEIRLWFFESSQFPMINFEQEVMKELKPEYIQNVVETFKSAQKYNIKIYMTIFDAHSYLPHKRSKEKLARLKRVFQEQGTQEFLNNIFTPLLMALDQQNLSQTLSKIDLINEGDAVVNRFGFDQGWDGAKRMICQWKNHLSNFKNYAHVPVTISLRLHPLIIHPLNLLKDDGPLSCAGIIDFHSYDNDGDIYRCGYIKKYVEENKKNVILGEFGQSYFNHRYSDQLQLDNTETYIKNAQKCGFSQALAWRLSDVREGYNKEARYSFEAFGKLRPAYYSIQKHNLE
jgi:hypothetical protein